MPERDWSLRIRDIAVAIDKIERYTATMTSADFQADERTVDAVLRNFEIIGEAAHALPAGYPSLRLPSQPSVSAPADSQPLRFSTSQAMPICAGVNICLRRFQACVAAIV